MSPSTSFEAIADALKVAVAALRDTQIPFVLAGSIAAWARGGPEPQNDLDLMVKPQDADAALKALTEIGMRPERPPEEWLYKAWHGDVMIDLIFEPAGLDMDDEVFARADTIPVLAVSTPVMALVDILSTKLLALDEHCLDYSSLLGMARALREQVDWDELRRRTFHSPYARAFFTLVEGLGVAPGASAEMHSAPRRVRVTPHLAPGEDNGAHTGAEDVPSVKKEGERRPVN